ncbi:unnamed protein product [Blepharisma stoltei]|uniref:RING-type domain-containing protein n=1 Tax=Blepharisma stoltei TaxID=1481888 RepID=A0AAU9K8Q1_9CILI|nr:unnamed protein product [Blepharisma stoltei]
MKSFNLVYILAISNLARGCSQLCTACSTITGVWIVNNCTNQYCRAKDSDCNNNCVACLVDSLPLSCGLISSSNEYCENSASTCGGSTQIYNSAAGSITLPTQIGQLQVCEWFLDLRKVFSSQDNHYVDVKILFESPNQNDMNIGNLTIWAYDIYTFENPPKLSTLSPIKFTLQPDSLASMLAERLIKADYLIIDYTTTKSYSSYAGIHITWVSQVSSSSSSNVDQVLTIVALSLSVFFTLVCSITVAWRIIRTIRRRDRIIDGARVVYPQSMGRAREYEVIPDDSAIILSEDNIERYMPKSKYTPDLVEVGECTCCVCFEEFKEDIEVRKLLCKHVFHASCIEDWLVSQGGIPKCPLCKLNPFQPLFPPENAHEDAHEEVHEEIHEEAQVEVRLAAAE